jgi:hypothetical protein
MQECYTNLDASIFFPLKQRIIYYTYKISFFPWKEEGERERVNILGYGNTGDGESRGRKRKTYNSFFHFRFHHYK